MLLSVEIYKDVNDTCLKNVSLQIQTNAYCNYGICLILVHLHGDVQLMMRCSQQ